MTGILLIAFGLLVIGVVLALNLRSWWDLIYPMIVASVLILLIVSGALSGEDNEFTVSGRIILSLLWTALPAAVGVLVGIGAQAVWIRE